MDLKSPTLLEADEVAEISPLAREMLHEKISVVLKKNLMMGRFVPGQKLPLRTLARSLGVSLMPVRDALQRLESIGCVELSANRSMVVPVYTSKEMKDIRDLHMLLEGEAAAKAAMNRTQDQLDSLHIASTEVANSATEGNLPRFLEANFNFHMSVADASQISFITALLEPLWLRIGPSIRQSKPDASHMWNAVRFHTEVCEAILHQNAEAARLAIRSDIFETNQFLSAA